MALHDFFTSCCMMDKQTHADGFGSIVDTWTEGAQFSAGIAMVNSTEAKVAYQNGLKRIYSVVTDENISLRQGDRIKRLNDGLELRITSNASDMTTPATSRMKYRQCNAEVILP